MPTQNPPEQAAGIRRVQLCCMVATRSAVPDSWACLRSLLCFVQPLKRIKMLLPRETVVEVSAVAVWVYNVGWGFCVFVWMHTEGMSVVGSPSATRGTIWGFCLWCVPSNAAWSVSAGEPGSLLENLYVLFPRFPPFSICLLRTSTFSTRPANKPLTLKTNTLRLFSSTMAGKERNAVFDFSAGFVFVFQEHSICLTLTPGQKTSARAQKWTNHLGGRIFNMDKTVIKGFYGFFCLFMCAVK